MLRYGRHEHQNLCQTLPNFFHAVVRARDSDTMISIFSGLYKHFLKLKYQQGLRLWPHPVAKLFEVFSHFCTMNENSQNDTRMILLTRTCTCDYIYTYKQDLFFAYSKFEIASQACRLVKCTIKFNHRVKSWFLTVEKHWRRNDELMFSFKQKYDVR